MTGRVHHQPGDIGVSVEALAELRGRRTRTIAELEVVVSAVPRRLAYESVQARREGDGADEGANRKQQPDDDGTHRPTVLLTASKCETETGRRGGRPTPFRDRLDHRRRSTGSARRPSREQQCGQRPERECGD